MPLQTSSFFDRPASRYSSRRTLVLVSVLSVAILAGCASRKTPAPITDISSIGTSTMPAADGTYVVRPGDTLYKIAQAHNMSVSTLASLNQITDPTQLRVGQTLSVSGSGAPVQPTVAIPTPVPTTPIKPVVPTVVARAADASLIAWDWPASGEIIQGFNANTKGIDIAGEVGAPIVAAAPGEVMYAGNGVRGLGNLVLVGHSNGFITAYAHNDTLLVKSGQTVQKGDKIATLGQSDTSSPRLHFEIRRSGTPVNPLSYLPAR